jgi:hypothetical protein
LGPHRNEIDWLAATDVFWSTALTTTLCDVVGWQPT